MGFKFPYGNEQQLNLNWFIKKFKELLADWQHEQESIDGALDAEIQRAEDALSDVYTARDTTIAAKNDALQAKADALTAAANAAQYWQNAAASANSAATSAVTALQAAQDAADDADQTSSDRAGVAADKAAVAADKATVASDKATVAQDKADVDDIKDMANAAALRSEGWADGTQNGTAVTSGSPYYENNAKYFKEQAEGVLQSIPEDYTALTQEVTTLKNKYNTALFPYASLMPDYFRDERYGRIVTIKRNRITVEHTYNSSTTAWYSIFGKRFVVSGSGTPADNKYQDDDFVPFVYYDRDVILTRWVDAIQNANRSGLYLITKNPTTGVVSTFYALNDGFGNIRSISILSMLPEIIANGNFGIVFKTANSTNNATTEIFIDGASLDSKIADTEITATASKAYNINDFLLYNSRLYRVIQPISTGATLTPNTNITLTSVGAELTQILNS